MEKDNEKATVGEVTITEVSRLDQNDDRRDEDSGQAPAFDPLEGIPLPPIVGVTELETRQLTVRSLVFGAFIGSIAAAGNIYLGLMIGWGFGAGMLSAMLGYAALKGMSHFPVYFGGGFFGPRENCSVQTAANAAASGTSVFVAAIPAMYQLGLLNTPEKDIPRLFTLGAISIFFGTFFAVALRRFSILQQRLPFPSGTATANLIRSLHIPHPDNTVRNMLRCLYISLAASFIWKVGGSYAEGILQEWHVFYWLVLNGCEGAQGGEDWRWIATLSPEFFGIGMLVGLNASISFLCGTVFTNGILGPIFQATGITAGPPLAMRAGAVPSTAKYWMLWPGVVCMICASFTDVAVNGKVIYLGLKATILELYDKVRRRSRRRIEDVIEDPAPPEEQVPLWAWSIGLLISTVLTWVILATQFGVPAEHTTVAMILGFMMAVVATQAAGATDINPVGAMGKTGQFVIGGMTKGQNKPLKVAQMSNLAAGTVVAQAASHTVDLLYDLKTGHLLGASPKGQFWAQIFGSCIAIFPATGLFIVFTKVYPCIIDPDAETCKFKMPAVMAWKAVTIAMTAPEISIPPSSAWFTLLLGIATVTVTVVKKLWIPQKYQIWVPNMMSVGLAFVVMDPQIAVAMAFGAIFNAIGKSKCPKLHSTYALCFATGIMAGPTTGGAVIALLEIAGIGPSKVKQIGIPH